MPVLGIETYVDLGFHDFLKILHMLLLIDQRNQIHWTLRTLPNALRDFAAEGWGPGS